MNVNLKTKTERSVMSGKKENKHVVLKTACGTLAAGAVAYSGYAYLLFRNAFETD